MGDDKATYCKMKVIRTLIIIVGALIPWVLMLFFVDLPDKYVGVSVAIGIAALLSIGWFVDGYYDMYRKKALERSRTNEENRVLSPYYSVWAICTTLLCGWIAVKGDGGNTIKELVEFVSLLWVMMFFWRLVEYIELWTKK